MKVKLFFVILFLASLLFIAHIGTINHEKVHGVVCEHFGGESVYNYSLFKGTTTCQNISYESMAEYRQKAKLDIQNEIVAYNLLDLKAYIIIIAFILFLIFLYIVDIRNDYRLLARMKYNKLKGGNSNGKERKGK